MSSLRAQALAKSAVVGHDHVVAFFLEPAPNEGRNFGLVFD